MKLASQVFAWLWMVLVLNAMFQSCFQTWGVTGDDPVNSLSESVFEFEDGLSTDEQDESSRKLRAANVLHWQCEMEAVKIGLLPPMSQKQAWAGLIGICLNFSGEVLLPPPDGLPLA